MPGDPGFGIRKVLALEERTAGLALEPPLSRHPLEVLQMRPEPLFIIPEDGRHQTVVTEFEPHRAHSAITPNQVAVFKGLQDLTILPAVKKRPTLYLASHGAICNQLFLKPLSHDSLGRDHL